jgi:hypothetical protein
VSTAIVARAGGLLAGSEDDSVMIDFGEQLEISPSKHTFANLSTRWRRGSRPWSASSPCCEPPATSAR